MKFDLKSVVAAVVLIVTGVLSILAWQFSENAKTPTGWTLWDITGAVSIATFLGTIFYLGKKKSKPKQ
jgi:hypothetical protein